MIFQKAKPQTRVAGWAFVSLLALFWAISLSGKPVVGLTGMGAVLVLGSLTVEANKRVIWEQYKKGYKTRGKSEVYKIWHQPDPTYYYLNVYLIWPLMFLLGLGSIYAAYLIG
jgi:hypothetical protein